MNNDIGDHNDHYSSRVERETSIMDGTCKDFCPAKERQERLHFGNIATVEMVHSERPGWTQKALLVKKYHRSAAGQLDAHHSEVRPPVLLLQVVQYLCSHVIDLDKLKYNEPRWRDDRRKSTARPLFAGDLELFLRDRLRMVAKDLALQGYSADGQRTHPDAICCLEAIVRFHLVVAHDCCEAKPADFDSHMNWTSLSGYVASLDQLYKLAHRQQPRAVSDVWCRCEPTMRAYMLLAMLPAPSSRMWRIAATQNYVLDNIRASKRIQIALKEIVEEWPHIIARQSFHTALSVCQACLSGDYVSFFAFARSCKDVVFLCGMHAQFDRVRLRALHNINQVYRNSFDLDFINEKLCCNNLKHTQTLCTEAGFKVQLSTSEVLGFALDKNMAIPAATAPTTTTTTTAAPHDIQKNKVDTSICRRSHLVVDLFVGQTRGSVVLGVFGVLEEKETINTSSPSITTSEMTTLRREMVESKSQHPSTTSSSSSSKKKDAAVCNKKLHAVVDSISSGLTIVSSIDKLGNKIVVEVRNVENPPGRAFVFKDDVVKSRSKKKKTSRQAFICRMDQHDAQLYGAQNDKECVITIESKFMAMYNRSILNREHRLALSVLQLSGIRNAAVAILCDAAHATKFCRSFQKRETESVIGLFPVPLLSSSTAQLIGGTDKTPVETKGVTNTQNQSTLLGLVGKQEVVEAWHRKPLTKQSPKLQLKIGHHLVHMLELLSQAIPQLQKTGKLTTFPKALQLLLIAQSRRQSKSIKLDCPGGKRHFAETTEACAIREVNEEVGFQMLSPNQKFDFTLPLDETMCGFVAVFC